MIVKLNLIFSTHFKKAVHINERTDGNKKWSILVFRLAG